MEAAEHHEQDQQPTRKTLSKRTYGDPACSEDRWFRPITSRDSVRNHEHGVRLHHSFVKKFTSPQQVGSNYKSELSGRIRSLAGSTENIHTNGTQHANLRKSGVGNTASAIEFVGVAWAKVSLIRKWQFSSSDAIHTPTGFWLTCTKDRAHSDLVLKDHYPGDVVAFKDKIAEGLSVILAENIETFQEPKPVATNYALWFAIKARASKVLKKWFFNFARRKS